MKDAKKAETTKHVSRRDFLKSSSAALALAAMPVNGYLLSGRKKRNKMILSFYMDDTNPEIVKADAFKYFLDYCMGYGIRGESSAILGYSGKSIAADPDDNQRIYAWQVKQAHQKGIDTHMEVMTHNTLFDFRNGRKNEGGIHEGLWLHEPGYQSSGISGIFFRYIGRRGKIGY